MQIRNFFSTCTVISLFTCFFLLSLPLLKDQLFQSTAWGGNQGWSDAFGSSQERTPSSGKSDQSGGGWNTVIDNQSSSPEAFDQPSPARDRYEKPNIEQREEPPSHPQNQEKSVQTDTEQISNTETPYQTTRTYAKTEVLFDGTMGENWTEYSASGGNFASQAKLTNNGLLVEVPEKSGWGKTGIFSSKPLIWLDDFGYRAKYHISFDFIPEETTGFVIALGKNIAEASHQQHIVLRWDVDPATNQGSYTLTSCYWNKIDWKKTVSGTAPNNISFTLKPGMLIISQGDTPIHVCTWSDLTPNTGYRIHVFSHAFKKSLPVKMALKKIMLSSNPGEPIETVKPAPGVAELPVKTLFSGKLGKNWETFGVDGGDFEKFGRFEDGKMIVSVPAKNSWGTTGILSKKPLIDLDFHTFNKAPYHFQIKVDPQQSKGFVIAFGNHKKADMWRDHKVWVGVGKSTFYYYIDTFNDETESREKPADWSGIINIIVSKGWFSVQLDDGKTMRTQCDLKPGYKFYITAFSQSDLKHKGEASSLALESITLQKIAPEGMTKLKRWELIDDNDFDADKFLNDLKSNLY